MNIYLYKHVSQNNMMRVAVAAENGTAAHDGLKQQYPNLQFTYIGMVDSFIQVNGNIVLDNVEVKEVSEPTKDEKENE
jgi:hypothetical protein